MSKKPTKLIGLPFLDFDSLKGKEINLQSARLIPFYKPGDEMALTSTFLSAFRLIKEFRNNISQAINLARSGNIHVFTEIEFLLFDKKRVDGLILFVRGKKIVDAVLLEVKNKSIELDDKQISEYLSIAREYCIPNLLTISNQFVSYPTQSPLSVKPPKHIHLYHLSWSFILTIAHILLTENENNISDEDQIEIMKEVVEYFESNNSGIVGFTQMKQGWTEVVDKVSAGTPLKFSDKSVDETISSWLQEERDMALILSRELGLLVRSGQKKYKDNLKARIDHEKKELIENKYLESVLQIEGAASNINIRPFFDRKNVEMYVTLLAPQDKGTRAQITWIRNQIKNCKKKNSKIFKRLENDLMIDIYVKYSSKPIRFPIGEIESACDDVVNKEIRSFRILLLNELGAKFKSRKGFVMKSEKMLIDYYQGIVQYLKKWEKTAPQMHKTNTDDSEDI